jgi:PKD repeat protein
MATDKSQHMDIFGKQELGWVVPKILKPGETVVNGFRDSKADTNRIEWQTANGTPYVLEGPNVHNAEAYAAPLPKKRIIDPAIVPSGSHLWWSGAGDMFGCTPVGAHNMDLALPQLENLAAGTSVELSFKSWWNIEWDFDYGFVLVSTDGGTTYTSLASKNNYTTPAAVNPTANSCQAQFGNGITGSSGSYGTPPTHPVDRAEGAYPTAVFLNDAFDLTPYAGRQNVVIRFSYATDPGVANPGWFIDDLKVTAGANTLFSDDFENGQHPQIFNGGCNEDLQTGKICTDGFIYVNAAGLSSFDHAYFLEMRDRSGFDHSGRNQNSRAAIGFQPGMLLVYTNEINGYGNFSGSAAKAPNQSPLDAVPVPGATAPNLNDAAFTAAAGRTSFSDSKTAAKPGGWIDNYRNDKSAYGDDRWHFDYNCLTFDVLAMGGTDIGPINAPWNLTGDVRFTLGEGCGPMNYGYGVAGPNQAPVAVAVAKPTTAAVGEEISFSGLGSSDDRQMPDALNYAWDFEQDGTVDAQGAAVQHAYSKAGIYRATLTVTDSKGVKGTDVVRITVQ